MYMCVHTENNNFYINFTLTPQAALHVQVPIKLTPQAGYVALYGESTLIRDTHSVHSTGQMQ